MKYPLYNNVEVMDHPLIKHKISIMRSVDTGSKEFRELVNEIAMLMGYEVTRDLPLMNVQVETPLAIASSCFLRVSESVILL